MATVSGNLTILCFQAKIMLEKQKKLIQTFRSNQKFYSESPVKVGTFEIQNLKIYH